MNLGRSNGSQSRRASTSDRLRPAPTFNQPVTFTYQIQNHQTRIQRLTKAFKVYRLMVTTLICVIAGLIIGLLCRPYSSHWTERQFMYIEMPGELYLRFLKLMILPLLASNVILSFGTIRGKLSSQLGKIASFLYFGSNLMAITVAIILALVIGPGRQQTKLHLKPIHNKLLMNFNNVDDNHDALIRYREYHPMYYHTDHNEILTKVSKQTEISAVDLDHIDKLLDLSEEEIAKQILGPLLSEDYKNIGPDLDYPEDVSVEANSNSGRSSSDLNQSNLSTKLPIDVVLDVLRNLVPDSLVGATLQQTRTRLLPPRDVIVNKNGSTDPMPHSWPMGHETVNQANVIGLLAISVLTGVALSHMDEASKPMLELCACISELSLRIGIKAINLAPVCIMFLLIGQVARSSDLGSMAGELFMYSTTVVLALIVHGFILLPLVYYMITKRSPITFLFGMFEALVASFATSSSSATTALMLNCLAELNLNVTVVRAFGPLGSVFNMNGTAIYEAVAVIFIAQTLNVTLPFTSILLVGFSAAIASLSTSGIPSSGMMTMVIVLNAVNLPVLQLSLIYIVDFIIDRFRTVVNIWSGAIVCGIIDYIIPEHLFEEDQPIKYREMMKYRARGCSLSSRKSLATNQVDLPNMKPQVISVTITPPTESSFM